MMQDAKYLHEVVLFIDVSGGRTDDSPFRDKDFVRSKSDKNRVARFVYVPGDQGPPVPAPSSPFKGPFSVHLSKLAREQPSRLTILAHGRPPVIGVNNPFTPEYRFAPGNLDGKKNPHGYGNPYTGYDGVAMAHLLRYWGLRQVSRISVIACHAAVREKLSAKERRKTPFNLNPGTKNMDLFKLMTKDSKESLLTQEDKDELDLLMGSFGQQFHLALTQPPFPAVRTEVTARVEAMKTSPQGRNHVALEYWRLGRPYDLDSPLAHKAPGSKFLFCWEDGRQAVKSVYYDESTSDDGYDSGFEFGSGAGSSANPGLDLDFGSGSDSDDE